MYFKLSKISFFVCSTLFLSSFSNTSFANSYKRVNNIDNVKDSKNVVDNRQIGGDIKFYSDTYLDHYNQINSLSKDKNGNLDNNNLQLKRVSQKNIKQIVGDSKKGGESWEGDYRSKYKVYSGAREEIKDKHYATRQTHGNKRVVYVYGEENRNNQSGIQDSTYIIPDKDFEINKRKEFDCSKFTVTTYDPIFACPNGQTFADNNLWHYGYYKGGTNYLYNLYKAYGYYGFPYYHSYEGDSGLKKENNPKALKYAWWNATGSLRGGIYDIWYQTIYNATGHIENIKSYIGMEKVRQGLQLFETTYTGKGKIYAYSIEDCLKTISIQDPNTYSKKESKFIADNCAATCPARNDEGVFVREEIIENCATKKDPQGNLIYSSTDKNTISTEHPRGTARKYKVKKYLFKNSKGYMYNPKIYSSLRRNNLRTDDLVHSCDLWEEYTEKESFCEKDPVIIQALINFKQYIEPPKPPSGGNGGSVSVRPGSGCTNCSSTSTPTTPAPPPPKEKPIDIGKGVEVNSEISSNSQFVPGQSAALIKDRYGRMQDFRYTVKQYKSKTSDEEYYYIVKRGLLVKVRVEEEIDDNNIIWQEY